MQPAGVILAEFRSRGCGECAQDRWAGKGEDCLRPLGVARGLIRELLWGRIWAHWSWSKTGRENSFVDLESGDGVGYGRVWEGGCRKIPGHVYTPFCGGWRPSDRVWRSLRGIVKRYSKDGGVGRDAFNQRVPSARNVKLLPEMHSVG